MKNTEISNIQLDVNLVFEVDSAMYVESIKTSDITSSDGSYSERIKKILNFLFSTKKQVASSEDGYKFVTQLMLGSSALQKSEVLTFDGNDFATIFAEKKDGIIKVWKIRHKNTENRFGSFARYVLVKSKKPLTMPKMLREQPSSVAKEFVPAGGRFNNRHYVLESSGLIWEKYLGFWIKNPKIEKSISRYFSTNFGPGVLSQAVLQGVLISLLENGMIFDGQKICPKNIISKEEYCHLVELAALQFQGWLEISTGTGWDLSEPKDVHKDISPCLFWE